MGPDISLSQRRSMTVHSATLSSQCLVAAAAVVLTTCTPLCAAQSRTPEQHRIVAPASTDPFVARRNANAQANAEYRAAKKVSKSERRASVNEADAQYKEEVGNARINRKADRDAASNALKASELERTSTLPHVSH